MIWLFVSAMLASPSQASAGDGAIDVSALMLEVTREVNASNPTSTLALLEATSVCEGLLSRSKLPSDNNNAWVNRFNYQGSSIFTRGGTLVFHILADGDFVESCGVIAIPSDPYHLVQQAFEDKYQMPLLSDKGDNFDRLYPTANMATKLYTYRFRSAENPKAALSITIRHKE